MPSFSSVAGASTRTFGSVIIAAIAFLVYLTSRGASGFDSVPAALVPITVLTQGTTHLDAFEAYYSGPDHIPYFLHHGKSGTVSSYPIATGLIAIPIYLGPVVWYSATHEPSIADWVKFSTRWQKVSAAFIAALGVIAFFRVCLALGAPVKIASWLSVAFAFGSQLWSTASQALWMHGPGLLFMLLAVLYALRHARSPNARDALLVGVSCGVALAVRLNNLLLVGPLLLWLVWTQRRYWLLSLLPTMTSGVGLAIYNRSNFGNLAGSYTLSFDSPLASGLAGVLCSPARGLLVYFPLALLGVAGFIAVVRMRTTSKSIYLVFAVFVLLSTLLVAKWRVWSGGHCWGPRLLSEIEPFLLFAIIPLARSLRLETGKHWLRYCFLLALSWSVFSQAVGSYFYIRSRWDAQPANIDQHPERLWDFYDNPIGRSVTVAYHHYQKKWR